MTDVTATHTPSRPDWSCTACRQEWPCILRKRQLKYLYQGNPVELGNQLRSLPERARPELPALSEEALADRFVGWSNRPISVLEDLN